MGDARSALRGQAWQRWSSSAIYASIQFLVLTASMPYIGILFFGSGPGTTTSLEFQVAAQKIIVYASVINLGL